MMLCMVTSISPCTATDVNVSCGHCTCTVSHDLL